jgi:ribosomal protein S18 acetylase RimI-like enzyme
VEKSIYKKIAELHIEALDQSFLSTLGVAFLSLMYEAIDKSEKGTLILRKDGSEVIGFVAGAISVGGIYQEMFRYKRQLLASLLPAMFSLKKLIRIGENFLYARREDDVGSMNLPNAELLTIAVKSGFRGRRIADQLFSDLSRAFSDKGVTQFRIVVGESLAPAHCFYRRMGARALGEVFLHGKSRSMVYVYDCGSVEEREEL